MPIRPIEVSTFSKIPSFVPFGVEYFTQDTADLYVGTGASTGPAVVAVNGGGGGTPSGNSGDIQFNSAGVFGGSDSLNYNPTALSTPSAPTVTQGGTPGSTTVAYQVVAVNTVGQTLSSAVTTSTTSTASLSSSNYNNIVTPANTGATAMWVYRTSSTQIPHSVGFIGSVAPGATLQDTGLAADQVHGQSGTLPVQTNNSAGLGLQGNFSVTSISGPTTAPTTPLQVIGRLAVGDPGVVVPGNAQTGGAGSPPGGPTPGILLASGPDNIGNSLYMWNCSPNVNPQIVQMQSGGSFAAPDNTWGGTGIGVINSLGFIGGAVQDWRTYTIIEYGSSDTGNPTADTPHGRIQLGVINGTLANRPGFVIGSYSDASPNRTINTNLVDQRWYNVGYANVYVSDASDFERAEATWNTVANTFSFGPTAGGSGTLRAMKLTGTQVQHPAGVQATPGVAIGEATTGWYESGHNLFSVNNLNPAIRIDQSSGLTFESGYWIAFSASGGFVTQDTTIARGSAKVVYVGAGSDSTGTLIANGGYGVTMTATSTIGSISPVKADTSNANQIVVVTTTDTGPGIVVGVCINSPNAGAKGQVITTGIAPLVLGTGTAAIGNFVVADTTTNGRVKCTTSYPAAGALIGIAMAALSTVGNSFNVMVGLR